MTNSVEWPAYLYDSAYTQHEHVNAPTSDESLKRPGELQLLDKVDFPSSLHLNGLQEPILDLRIQVHTLGDTLSQLGIKRPLRHHVAQHGNDSHIHVRHDSSQQNGTSACELFTWDGWMLSKWMSAWVTGSHTPKPHHEKKYLWFAGARIQTWLGNVFLTWRCICQKGKHSIWACFALEFMLFIWTKHLFSSTVAHCLMLSICRLWLRFQCERHILRTQNQGFLRLTLTTFDKLLPGGSPFCTHGPLTSRFFTILRFKTNPEDPDIEKNQYGKNIDTPKILVFLDWFFSIWAGLKKINMILKKPIILIFWIDFFQYRWWPIWTQNLKKIGHVVVYVLTSPAI